MCGASGPALGAVPRSGKSAPVDCFPCPSRLWIGCARSGDRAQCQGGILLPLSEPRDGHRCHQTVLLGRVCPQCLRGHFSASPGPTLPSLPCHGIQSRSAGPRHWCQAWNENRETSGKGGTAQGVWDGRKGLTFGKGKSQREREENALPRSWEDPWAVVEPLCLSHSKWVGKIHGKCPARSSPELQEQLSQVPQRAFSISQFVGHGKWIGLAWHHSRE